MWNDPNSSTQVLSAGSHVLWSSINVPSAGGRDLYAVLSTGYGKSACYYISQYVKSSRGLETVNMYAFCSQTDC